MFSGLKLEDNAWTVRMSSELKDALKELLAGDVETEDLGNGRKRALLRLTRSADTSFLFDLSTRRAPQARAAATPDAENRAKCPACGEQMAAADKFCAACGKAAAEMSADAGDGPGTVEGIASSTSRDWYGTEMSLQALETMAAQFKSGQGIPLTETHGSWLSGAAEWDCVVGRSIDAVIARADVADPVMPGEAQYTLTVSSELYAVPKAIELAARLDAGQVIGQSIGGWFTELSVIYDEETGDLERIIILAVVLDHLAITRMPANPDAIGISKLRSRLANASRTIATGRSEAAQRARLAAVPLDNRSSVTPETQQPVSVAAEAGSGNDDSNPPVRAGAEEISMTPEQIAELVQRSITEGLKGLPEIVGTATTRAIEPLQNEIKDLRARMEQVEQRQATLPKPEPAATLSADGDMKALQAELAEARSVIAAIAESPMRRGIHVDGRTPIVATGPGADSAFRSIVAECRSAKHGIGLAAVVERHIGTISEEEGPANVNKEGSSRNLTRILAAGLRAAEADGLIGKRGAAEWS